MEGVQRFNELCDFVKNDRIANEAFDNEYCGKMTKQKVDDGKKSSTRLLHTMNPIMTTLLECSGNGICTYVHLL